MQPRVLGWGEWGPRKGGQGGFGQESAQENLDQALIKDRRRWLGSCHPNPSLPRIREPGFTIKQEDNSVWVTVSRR